MRLLRLYLSAVLACAIAAAAAHLIAGEAANRVAPALCLAFLVGVCYALFMTREGRR